MELLTGEIIDLGVRRTSEMEVLCVSSKKIYKAGTS